jgi:hypothetical protein
MIPVHIGYTVPDQSKKRIVTMRFFESFLLRRFLIDAHSLLDREELIEQL